MQNQGTAGPSDRELRQAIPQASGAHEIRVGIFVLIGLVSFMVVLFMMTDPAVLRGRYKISTVVDNALGIRRGDPVQMKGVNIGRVHQFALRDDSVEIVLEVDGQWQIPSDSRTRLTSAGLLGGMTIEVLPGTASNSVREGMVIPGSGGAPPLMEAAGVLATDAEAVLSRIKAALTDETVAGVEESVLELRDLLRNLSRLTSSQSEQLDRLTTSLNETAAGMSEATPELNSAVARADSTMLSLNQASVRMRGAAESLDDILGRMQRGEGSLGKLLQDDSLYVALTEAAQSIEQLTTDIREHPGRYLKISVF